MKNEENKSTLDKWYNVKLFFVSVLFSWAIIATFFCYILYEDLKDSESYKHWSNDIDIQYEVNNIQDSLDKIQEELEE